MVCDSLKAMKTLLEIYFKKFNNPIVLLSLLQTSLQNPPLTFFFELSETSKAFVISNQAWFLKAKILLPTFFRAKNETFEDMVETLDSIGVAVSSCSSYHYCKKPELGFYAISNYACDVSEVCNVENIWKWSRIEIKFKVFSSFNLCNILMHKMVQSKCLFKYSRNLFITREPE